VTGNFSLDSEGIRSDSVRGMNHFRATRAVFTKKGNLARSQIPFLLLRWRKKVGSTPHGVSLPLFHPGNAGFLHRGLRSGGVSGVFHSSSQLHNLFISRRKRKGCGFHRNPLILLVGHVGFEPTTS
jgi:hypothetical protein